MIPGPKVMAALARTAIATRGADSEAGMRRASYYWAAALGAVLVALCGINYYMFVSARDEILRKEEQQLQRIVDATVTAVDNVLGSVSIALDRIRVAQKEDLRPRDLYNVLRAMVESHRMVRTLAITDKDGIVIHSSYDYPAPKADLSHTEAFQYFAGGGNRSPYFSVPIRDTLNLTWQTQVAIALFDDGGKLANIIAADIDLQYVYRELSTRNERGTDQLLLVDHELRLLAAHPWYDEEIGTPFADTPIFRKLVDSGRPQVSAVVVDGFTGEHRLAAARWLPGRHFALATSRLMDPVLESWRISSAVIAAGSGVIVLVLCLAWLSSARAQRQQYQQSVALELTNAALLAETRRAEDLAAVKADFLANMSHEIRTPLNGIIGYAGLALEEPDAPTVQQYVARVLDAGRMLRVIIDEILDFSKAESGQLQLESAPFSIDAMIDHCMSIVRPAAVAKGLSFDLDVHGKHADWVQGDSTRLGQVLLNFLNNAVKFTEHGSVTLAASCVPRAGTIDMRFEVRDSGIGISSADQHRLFKRFSQGDSSISRRFGGTGLGLAISHRIIDAMGGEIGVESTAGAGSTFWCALSLPASQAPAANEVVPAAGCAAVALLHILVVDDQEMNRDLAATVLRRARHAVDVAEDGSIAVRMAREHRYDLILMDIQMPGMDGLETTRQIRALGGVCGRVPIVAMTANVLPDQIALYRAAGLAHHVAKPIDSALLLRNVVKWTKGDRAPAHETEAAPAETSFGVNVHDPAVWEDVKAMLGADRVLHFAGNLQNLLAANYWTYEPGEATDTLASSAHACVSLAGQLGFGELSTMSRKLETACLKRTGIELVLEEFDLARLRALFVLERLVPRPPVAPSRTSAGAA